MNDAAEPVARRFVMMDIVHSLAYFHDEIERIVETEILRFDVLAEISAIHEFHQ